MVNMFHFLESFELRGFLGISRSVYEEAWNQFFSTASITSGAVVSTFGGQNVVFAQNMFTEVLEFPSEGITSFSGLQKNEMEDTKSFIAKAGYFDIMTSERSNMMVEISTRIKLKNYPSVPDFIDGKKNIEDTEKKAAEGKRKAVDDS
ncbi:gcn5-like N-acetyltransferase [Dorcoceras hygrometricum]|uniref:Gcn5-like N-acetyltransferase n=1 Tax=Dorcoceras hygrometricum TaxID=472368 RepID=A0A2Z7APK5_9LAMI|nr:gcn5-like N-acetyltransferase [Dorcoceras hygrometricum]